MTDTPQFVRDTLGYLILLTPLVVAFSSILMRAAVATVQGLIGGWSSVQSPTHTELFKLVVISFLFSLGPIFLLNLLIGAVVGFSALAQTVAFFSAIPVCVLFTSSLVSQRMQVSFGAGLLVSSCFYFYCLFLVCIFPVMVIISLMIS